MHEALPDDFAERIAQLRVDGVTVGYLRPRPVELHSKKRPMRYGVDLDVVLLEGDGRRTAIDFADPEITSFKERASSGELSLNGQMYALHWLDGDETARLEEEYFDEWFPVRDEASTMTQRGRVAGKGWLRDFLDPSPRRRRTEPDPPQ